MVHIIHCQGHQFNSVLASDEDGLVHTVGFVCKHCALRVKTYEAKLELTGKQS